MIKSKFKTLVVISALFSLVSSTASAIQIHCIVPEASVDITLDVDIELPLLGEARKRIKVDTSVISFDHAPEIVEFNLTTANDIRYNTFTKKSSLFLSYTHEFEDLNDLGLRRVANSNVFMVLTETDNANVFDANFTFRKGISNMTPNNGYESETIELIPTMPAVCEVL